ncbi:peptide chain release factor 2 [bacterium]|nr:peptide chain release factor 2 [bacterium]MBU4560900.1 peptide chain release factor 2 [bacterium]
MERIEKETLVPDFWKDRKKAASTTKRLNALKTKLNSWTKLKEDYEELEVYLELLKEKEDKKVTKEVQEGISELSKDLDSLKLKSMLKKEEDPNNAILFIHAGAGGTESCDWANMLLRMYLRWVERKGYSSQILHITGGEEAGIRSATLLISGLYAYGYLKAESGVHRLVRISPFDAAKRRHTSFASVFASPEIDESIEVEIKDVDLRIDTYRASGAGGQHVNVTDSAVRITHLPTGIVAQCQNERSQHQNKATALKILRSRLFEYHREKEREKLAEIEKKKKKIEWGSQIRSYVLHPYRMVKDHRTKLEEGNVDKVLDGEIDEFIEAYFIISDR